MRQTVKTISPGGLAFAQARSRPLRSQETPQLPTRMSMAFAAGTWDGNAPDAAFHPWPTDLDAQRLTELFRRLILKMLVRRQRLSEAAAQKLLGWEHSGFSVWLGDPITPDAVESRRRLARYLVKAPLSRRKTLAAASAAVGSSDLPHPSAAATDPRFQQKRK